jgi:hypothetical protein
MDRVDPVQPSRAELTRLPPELLELIVQYLPQLSLSRISQSHSVLRSIALPRLYRHPYLETMSHLEKFLNAVESKVRGESIGEYVEVVSLF